LLSAISGLRRSAWHSSQHGQSKTASGAAETEAWVETEISAR
jgi:hypothetical protein